MYDALGVRRFVGLRSGVATVGHNRGIKIEKSLTINRSSEELYHFWRDLENLPLFMQHIKSVTSLGNNRSHWIVNAPAGTTVEWDAEIYNEIAPQLIAWRSIGNADINHAGSVHFQHAPGQKGTEVRVVLNYEPPFGKRIGKLVSKILTEEPEQQIEEDLHRFKQMMEAGEIATTEGQPSGRVSMGTREQGRRPEPEPVMQY
ncbi:MAG: SRPBCC family protein [Methanobacteriota archaeon]|nr:MAG: SRPBCC family protein [Euryarchaeota archaeon]